MKKKQKIGKARRDRYYHLAKETGYRARSAFKLIQLNRKYNFLQNSRVLIDLCAAPGGWLQVAANFMPMSSVIMGVDLVPIKNIKNVTTFTEDITTDSCRQQLKKELKTWKADCVLNDGAPNVGSAWVQDAFTQARLTLSALKLACEFLKKGGWFVTKVFRSKDYAPLLVSFQALFQKVHATKPQASRAESAEIFVVCQGFLAPGKIDPRLIDMKHVFKEIEKDDKPKIDIFRPEKQKRHRDGYEEGNYIQFTARKITEFLACENPVELLSTTNQLVLDTDIYLNHTLTTQEIKTCCDDIKVLGKKELKGLLGWRRKVRKEEREAKEAKAAGEKEEEAVEEKEEEEETEETLDKMIADLKVEEARDLKRKKRKERVNKKKNSERIGKKAAGMIESSLESDLFSIKAIKDKQHLGKVDTADMDEGDQQHGRDGDYLDEALQFESDEESGDESDGDNDLYDDELYGPKRLKIDDEAMQLSGEQEKVMGRMKKNQHKSTKENPLLVDMENDVATKPKTPIWFQKDVFKDIEEEEDDEDYDIEQIMKEHRKNGTKIIDKGQSECEEKVEELKVSKKNAKKVAKSCETQKDEPMDTVNKENDSDDDESDSDDSDIDDRSISQGRNVPEPQAAKVVKGDTFEVAPQSTPVTRFLTPEALALGAAIVTSRKRKRDIMDSSYNRFSFGHEKLPSWFADEEKKHNLTQLPITREEVNVYKERLKQINARPMKKLLEANARKQKRMLHKLEKTRRKADNILETTDVSEKEKMNQVKSIYKKAGLLSKKKIEKKYVVAKKKHAGAKYPRPSGVKGLYKVVDPRMKKDLRSMKQKEKTKKRGKKKK